MNVTNMVFDTKQNRFRQRACYPDVELNLYSVSLVSLRQDNNRQIYK